MTTKEKNQRACSKNTSEEKNELIFQVNPFQEFNTMKLTTSTVKNFYNKYLDKHMYTYKRGSICYYFETLNQQSQRKVIEKAQLCKQFALIMMRSSEKKQSQTQILFGGYIKFHGMLQLQKQKIQKKNQQAKQTKQAIAANAQQSIQISKQKYRLKKQLISYIIFLMMLISHLGNLLEYQSAYKWFFITLWIFAFVCSILLIIVIIYSIRMLSRKQYELEQRRASRNQIELTDSASSFEIKQEGETRQIVMVQPET